MSTNRRVVSVGYPAAAAISQFRLVNMNSDGQVAAATDGTKPIVGVCLNKPAAQYRGAEIAVAGSDVKFEAGAAVDEGDLVVAVAGGRGSAYTAGTQAGTAFVVGVCTQAASGSAALGAVLVMPFKYVTA